MQPDIVAGDNSRAKSRASLEADIIIANAPDPVFVSDLEGKILQANDAVSQLLGFREDEVLEQSLSRFISPEETREFLAALREVVERGVTATPGSTHGARAGRSSPRPSTPRRCVTRTARSSALSASCATCASTSRWFATWKSPRVNCRKRFWISRNSRKWSLAAS